MHCTGLYSRVQACMLRRARLWPKPNPNHNPNPIPVAALDEQLGAEPASCSTRGCSGLGLAAAASTRSSCSRARGYLLAAPAAHPRGCEAGRVEVHEDFGHLIGSGSGLGLELEFGFGFGFGFWFWFWLGLALALGLGLGSGLGLEDLGNLRHRGGDLAAHLGGHLLALGLGLGSGLGLGLGL
eukprot:scaffold114703_cov63-Phaeocystis_antarctica.AAC.1